MSRCRAPDGSPLRARPPAVTASSRRGRCARARCRRPGSRRLAHAPRRRARRDRPGIPARSARRRDDARRRATPRARRCPPREMVYAEATRAPRGRDQPGPIAVVQRAVAADVAEAVELRRRLQRHHHVVVGHLVARAATPAAEHTVARREVVEVEGLGAVAARRRRTDREREREALAGTDECSRGRDPLRGQVIRRTELVELAEATPVVVRAWRRAHDLAVLVDAVVGRRPAGERRIGDVTHAAHRSQSRSPPPLASPPAQLSVCAAPVRSR